MNPRARRIRKHNRRLVKSEVSGLTKKIMREIQSWNIDKSHEVFNLKDPKVKRLINLGFYPHEGFENVLIHRRISLVVKIMYSLGQPPEDKVPTLLVKVLKSETYAKHELVIQEKADVSHKGKNQAFEYICDRSNFNVSERIRKFGKDIHIGNVGLYKNKPVVIDW